MEAKDGGALCALLSASCLWCECGVLLLGLPPSARQKRKRKRKQKVRPYITVARASTSKKCVSRRPGNNAHKAKASASLFKVVVPPRAHRHREVPHWQSRVGLRLHLSQTHTLPVALKKRGSLISVSQQTRPQECRRFPHKSQMGQKQTCHDLTCPVLFSAQCRNAVSARSGAAGMCPTACHFDFFLPFVLCRHTHHRHSAPLPSLKGSRIVNCARFSVPGTN